MKIREIIFIFLLLIIVSPSTYGQSWLWANAAVNNNSSGETDPLDLTTDSAGNIFETGVFNGNINFGIVNLNTTAVSPNSGDAFLVKFDHNGKAIWGITPTIDSEGYVFGCSLATDKAGDVCMGGNYFYCNMSIGNNTFPFSSSQNMFIAMFSSSGSVKWTTHSNSPGDAYLNSLTIDNTGNVFVTGYFFGELFLDSILIDSVYAGYGQFFIAKYDSIGHLDWAKTANSYVQGTSSGNTVVTDAAGNVYVAGDYTDTMTIATKTLITKGLWPARQDNFLAKFNTYGNLIWISSAIVPSAYCYAGPGIFHNYGGRYLSIDNAENLYITGTFCDTAQFGTYTLINPDTAIFLVKYSSSGNILWAKENSTIKYAGTSYLQPYVISCDEHGSFYLSGGYHDSISFDSIKLKSNSMLPSFLIKFDTSGYALCGSSIDNFNDDNNCIIADPLNNDAFFSGDVEIPSGTGGCYFGSYYLAGTNEYAFLTKWTCTSCNSMLSASMKYTNIRCPGDTNGTTSFSLSGGTPPYNYSWTPAERNSPYISGLSAGTYTVTCQDYNFCTVKDSVTIQPPVPFVVSVCCDSSILRGQQVQLISSGGGSYSWSPANGLSCDTCPNPVAMPHQTTTYTLTVTSDSGCMATQYVTIDVHCGDVFVPDAFSPSGTHNNVLYVRGMCIEKLDFEVFDRWGNKVFESRSPDIGWDGNHNGVSMNVGTYVYYAKATMYDGSTIEKHGNVTLVR